MPSVRTVTSWSQAFLGPPPDARLCTARGAGAQAHASQAHIPAQTGLSSSSQGDSAPAATALHFEPRMEASASLSHETVARSSLVPRLLPQPAGAMCSHPGSDSPRMNGSGRPSKSEGLICLFLTMLGLPSMPRLASPLTKSNAFMFSVLTMISLFKFPSSWL